MKEFISIWNRFCGRAYSVVNSKSCHSDFNVCDSARKTSAKKSDLRGVLTVAAIGCILFGTGLIVLLLQPYELLFKWKCVFGLGGEIYELWRKPPVELYLKVYLFNVTNKDAFMEGREKLKIEEVGPYVYREFLSHENVTFNENGTLTTNPSHPLEWVPELSEGRSEDDQLILPHIALLAIAQVVSEKSFFTQFGLNLIIRQSNSYPLVQMSAKEFMFGYKSSLLTLGNQFMSEWIHFDKLGLIDRMYEFEGDVETVYTGENDVGQTGLIDTYRGSPQLPHWEGTCGNIRNASDGTKFRGYLKPDDKLLFYRRSLCRASTLVRVNNTVASGLDGYFYSFEEDSLDNGRNNTNNSCFCRNGRCLPAGVLDVADCYYGFPIGVSFPHFLYGEQSLLDGVEGSKPNPDLHKSHFIIEPFSGLPLQVAARYQINMVLGNLGPIAHVEQFSNMILPMLWIEIGMTGLPQSLNIRFYFYLYILPVLQTASIYISFIIGTVMFATASYKYLQRVKTIGKLYVTSWKDPYCMEDNVSRKLSTYAYTEKNTEMSHKELDSIYCDGLVTPLNRNVESTVCDRLENGVV